MVLLLMLVNKIPNLAEKPILTEVQAVNSKMITGTIQMYASS